MLNSIQANIGIKTQKHLASYKFLTRLLKDQLFSHDLGWSFFALNMYEEFKKNSTNAKKAVVITSQYYLVLTTGIQLY
jgi:hypothetical protein